MSLDAILKIAEIANAPLLSILTFFVWRIYANHLPHLENELQKIAKNIGERVARLEGRDDVRLD